MRPASTVPIVGAALTSGLCIYAPCGLRGALFCLFPGIAYRSPEIALKSAGLGLIVDILFNAGWMALGLEWEPRASYNFVLAHYLPPMHRVITHGNCQAPNEVQFELGLVGWTSVMFLVWQFFWPAMIPPGRRLVVCVVGAAFVGGAAKLLWEIAPKRGWLSGPHGRFDDYSPMLLVVALIASIPLCCLSVAGMIKLSSLEQAEARASFSERPFGTIGAKS
jgi:hypothetical protein